MAPIKPRVQTGLERLAADPPRWMKSARLGLLCNPASVDAGFWHARRRIDAAFPGRLKALFSPQHGFFAEKQDNMIESDDLTDLLLHIPVYSLYGKTRVPTREMFDAIDVLLVDLQDVGTRVYTFTTTVSYCMETAGALDKKVVILDRPNPIGGIQVEGNVLREEYGSFVGRYAIPMRHGLTMGELARLFNAASGTKCPLTVISMQGWTRDMYYPQTGLPWVAPSPNMPTPASAAVYPGQVIWEGTNISEGRGTTQPFELFGAPFLNVDDILHFLGEPGLPGAVLRPCRFEPTSNKWAGTPCNGFQIHVTDPFRYKPYAASLKLLRAVIALHPAQFQWKKPPYEYEFDRMPIDLILGDRQLRERIACGEDIDALETEWMPELNTFKGFAEKCYLY